MSNVHVISVYNPTDRSFEFTYKNDDGSVELLSIDGNVQKDFLYEAGKAMVEAIDFLEDRGDSFVDILDKVSDEDEYVAQRERVEEDRKVSSDDILNQAGTQNKYDDLSDDSTYECSECSESFASNQGRKVHLARKHT